jgi:RNA polymerase sigma factor (sigma-70 family)
MPLDRIESVFDVIPVELSAGISEFEHGDGEDPLNGGSSLPDADTEAFNGFLEGNDEAFRALYDAFERPLYLYIVRFIGSKTDAEDIFQDVWTRMYRLRGERKTVQRFAGLLFTVARNLSINAIRDRKVLPSISLDEAPEEELAARGDGIEDTDLRDMLERALLRLPPAQREAFILREYFGYSYEELAHIIGTSMVTAKARAWRGRERLRKMIGAWMELRKAE